MYESYVLAERIAGLCSLVFWILIIAIIVLLVLKAVMVNNYSEQSVLERWSALLPGQGGRSQTYLNQVEQLLKERETPFRVERQQIVASLLSSSSNTFIVCRLSSDYSAFIGCLSVGEDLEVNWLVQDHTVRGFYRVPFLGPLLLSVTKRYTFVNGNRVRALAALTHACAVEAAERVLAAAQLDSTKFNRKTSGKLGPL